jgi:hypothetical protein
LIRGGAPAIRSHTIRLWLISLAAVVFTAAHVFSLATVGIPYLSPLSFIFTCVIAWDVGFWASVVWAVLFHVVLQCILLSLGVGLLVEYPDVRGFLVLMMASSLAVQTTLAHLTARIRRLTGQLRDSRSALLNMNDELQGALAEVKELRGFLPICAWCKAIRDVSGNWEKMESYIARHSRATFTHGLCPKCLEAQIRGKSG